MNEYVNELAEKPRTDVAEVGEAVRDTAKEVAAVQVEADVAEGVVTA